MSNSLPQFTNPAGSADDRKSWRYNDSAGTSEMYLGVDARNGGMEVVSSPAIAAGVLTLNLANGNVFTIAHNAPVTSLVLQGAVTGRLCSLSLQLTQDATGGRAFTWAAGVPRWPGGAVPVLITTSNAVNWLELWTVNGGTTWYGALSGAGFA